MFSTSPPILRRRLRAHPSHFEHRSRVRSFCRHSSTRAWIANFWFPQNYHYAQSGALGTRTGYRWTVRNNTIRYAKTIGFDWGTEGGYAGHPTDNEGTNQSTPAVWGEHTVEHNVFERNEVSGVQGYGAFGNFRDNLIQDNGGLGCAGAENAVRRKCHGSGILDPLPMPRTHLTTRL